jgi:hypothetical protein
MKKLIMIVLICLFINPVNLLGEESRPLTEKEMKSIHPAGFISFMEFDSSYKPEINQEDPVDLNDVEIKKMESYMASIKQVPEYLIEQLNRRDLEPAIAKGFHGGKVTHIYVEYDHSDIPVIERPPRTYVDEKSDQLFYASWGSVTYSGTTLIESYRGDFYIQVK